MANQSKRASMNKPFQLLEITIISAQDLDPKNKKMRTYAAAWINPARRLMTVVDNEGGSNPTWNDKFVFRVDEDFLRRDTSAVEIEIYSVRWFRDSLVGSVRLLVGNVIPPPARPHHHQHFGMRFAAVQIRRPSGRPQGILNIGVAVLDSSMRSMPLYQSGVSAVGYRDLNDHLPQHNNNNHDDDGDDNESLPKPVLRRTRSDRSEYLGLDSDSIFAAIPRKINDDKESSILSISFHPPPPVSAAEKKGKGKGKVKAKAASLINVAPAASNHKDFKKGKASSVLSDSFMSKESSSKIASKGEEAQVKNKVIADEKVNEPKVAESPINKPNKISTSPITKPNKTPTSPILIGPKPKESPPPIFPNNPKLVIGGGGGGGLKAGNSILSDSEVGPSPSEVAAAMAMAERPRYPLEEERSSVLDGWSLDESVEGLRSKLERWRTELPPLYDRGAGYSSSSFRSSSQYTVRRRGGGGGEESGLFSCFGNVFGYECQCVCGKPAPPPPPPPVRGYGKGRLQTPSPFF